MHDGNVRIPERGKGTEEIFEAIISEYLKLQGHQVG